MNAWLIGLLVIGAVFVLALLFVPIIIAVSAAAHADKTRKKVERSLRLRK